MRRFAERLGFHTTLAALVLLTIVVGSVLHLSSNTGAAHLTWAVGDALVLVPLAWGIAQALRRGQMGVDIIALLAIVGALATGEYLAGAVIALMLSGGNALEEYAQGRAGRELSALVARAPRRARIRRGDSLVEVDAHEVVPNDVISVRAGEIVPVDGFVRGGQAVVDTSALTGEPLPVTVEVGSSVMSGAVNAGSSFELVALRSARDSTYAALVRLVEEAVARKAPMVRMADRYSLVFLAATLVLTAGAWIASGDPVRALAVLVIATPCPLILAPPVALVAGTSRAARQGVIVKGSAAIEALGRADVVLLDKTGTITLGTPALHEVVVAADGMSEDELIRLAAGIEQLSLHTLAGAVVTAAQQRDLELSIPTDVSETAGQGISGVLDGQLVAVGSAAYVRQAGAELPENDGPHAGVAVAHVAVDGSYAGQLLLTDSVRDDAHELTSRLREAGVERVVMATGDNATVARHVGDSLGITEVHAECTPEQKLVLLKELQSAGDGRRRSVIMVGDGVNDAPALAAADAGIAMGSAGASAASEAAEAVIVSGRISAVADAISIGRRSTAIARQSVIAGIGLSMAGMVLAALGFIPPLYGALAQEGIDLAVVINALRALRGR